MMKIALLADIHGNSLALDAALADIDAVGVDQYWILGDLVALGPDPVGVLERLSNIQNCCIIRGNTDRYVVTGDRPPPLAENLGTEREAIRVFAEIAGTFAWTQGAMTAAGWLDWLSDVPLEFRTVLPDGTRCLCVHATPGADDGPGIDKGLSDEEICGILSGCEDDLICVGHNHQPINRTVGRWRIVNPGSISNPRLPILEASYAILEASKEGYSIEHRLAEYDREQIILQLRALKHPGADFIINHMRGLHK
jgi:predicted phosphodiesterase